MQIPVEFILITSSVGALQSGFFSLYLLSAPKRRQISTTLLGCLLLVLAVRMAKSTGYYFSGGDLHIIFANIGYAAHLAIAPFLFLYVKSVVVKNFVFGKMTGLHFLPSFLVLIFAGFLDDNFWLSKSGGYFWSLYYFGAYFPFIYYVLFKNTKSLDKEKVWLLILTIGINLVWAAYAANFLLGLVSYITAPVLFSIVFYALSFFGLKHFGIFHSEKPSIKKYKNSTLTGEQIQDYAEQIETLMETEKIYRDSKLTLSKLARKLAVSRQIVSEVVNRHFEASFADYVNTYRLEEACRMLKEKENRDKKIASIAFECGFGTVSAFNISFKKYTQMTPSEYKKQHE